jgi:hypothetical protein
MQSDSLGILVLNGRESFLLASVLNEDDILIMDTSIFYSSVFSRFETDRIAMV